MLAKWRSYEDENGNAARVLLFFVCAAVAFVAPLRSTERAHAAQPQASGGEVAAGTSPRPPAAAGDVTFRATVDRPVVLPFEPVRVRLSVVNAVPHPLDLYADPFFTTVETTVGAERLRIRVEERSGTDRNDRRSTVVRNVKLRLAPGEHVSISVPVVAGEILHDDATRTSPRYLVPINRQVGEYSLRCEYPLRGGPKVSLAAVVDAAFAVADPPDAEKRLIAKLRADDSLSRDLFDHHRIPSRARRPAFEAIAETESPYADYARFALARMALGYDGTAGMLVSNEATLRAANDEYHRLLPDDPDAADKYCRRFAYHPFRSADEVTRAIGDVISAKSKNDDARLQAARKLAELRFAGEADLRLATTWLKAIRGERFPYRPDVLIMLKHVYERQFAPEAAAVVEELEENYYDSMEWLYFRALEVKSTDPIPAVRPFLGAPDPNVVKPMSFDEWAMYRIRR